MRVRMFRRRLAAARRSLHLLRATCAFTTLYKHVTVIVIDAECVAFPSFSFTDPFWILRYYLFDHYNKYEICGDGDGGSGLCSILSIGDLRLYMM